MSVMPARNKAGLLLHAILRSFRTRPDRDARELLALTDYDVERIAEDLNVSTAELCRLADSKDCCGWRRSIGNTPSSGSKAVGSGVVARRAYIRRSLVSSAGDCFLKLIVMFAAVKSVRRE